ncbi:jasmonate-induced oxygenase 4 [Nymphaea colorata]|nr:jasmonate-induced oxygenase 4 [Nymphaea colorata]
MASAAQRVQVLAESGVSHVPPSYVQPPEHRPLAGCRPTFSGVPLVDLRCSGDDVRWAIGEACRNWGVFQVIGHGVPSELLVSMRQVGAAFFSLPTEERNKFACDPKVPASEGYGSRMLASENDGVLDWRDYFDHHTLPESRRKPDRWPTYPPNYRKVVVEYSDQMKLLAQRLLHLMSESLGLPSSYIEDAVGEAYQNITISYYPPCPQPDLVLGLQAHSDMGAVTLLIQDDVGGLEALKGEEWINVQPTSDAIVVILGDQTEVMTNGVYKSAVHRAIVNSRQARLSVATFYDPSKQKRISAAPMLVSESSPIRYRDVLYGDYVSAWYGKGPDGKRNIDALRINQ